MASAELDAAAGQVWAEALGCGTQLPSEPGAHLVPGLAKQIAVRMIQDALPVAGIIRYRALVTNSPSLAIARSLGFTGYGQNLIVRLP